MKLTCILLTVAFLQVSAKGRAQPVTFSGKDVPLLKVFEAIKEQTGFVFFYDAGLLQQSKTITLKVKNKPLQELLQQVFNEQPLTWTIVNKTITILPKEVPVAEVAKQIQAEQPPLFSTIKGRITDEKGQPLNGATVLVKGSDNGVKTDSDGNFAIEAAPDAILVISYVGYETQEIAVQSRTLINTQLKLAVTVNEQIVVIGYGTQKKRDLTGSVSSVKGEDLAKQPGTNPIASLQGKVAGLTVSNTGRAGAGPVVRIRGVNSTNSAAPVYVVDGILQDDIDF